MNTLIETSYVCYLDMPTSYSAVCIRRPGTLASYGQPIDTNAKVVAVCSHYMSNEFIWTVEAERTEDLYACLTCPYCGLHLKIIWGCKSTIYEQFVDAHPTHIVYADTLDIEAVKSLVSNIEIEQFELFRYHFGDSLHPLPQGMEMSIITFGPVLYDLHSVR